MIRAAATRPMLASSACAPVITCTLQLRASKNSAAKSRHVRRELRHLTWHNHRDSDPLLSKITFGKDCMGAT